MNGTTQAPATEAGGGAGTVDIHTPFTAAERIQQLSEIDNDIASLLVHLSSAMRALATPPGTSVAQPNHNHSSSSSSNNNNNNNNNNTTHDGGGDDDDDDIDLLQSPTSSPSSPSPASPPSDPLTTFKTAQTHFFRTVDRIDKHLTRQIFALEEAGIITLRPGGANTANPATAGAEQAPPPQQQQQQQQQQTEAGEAGPKTKAGGGRIEPDGLGRYGLLDVGQLNVASSAVERDMEGEMWRRAREHLERVMRDIGRREGGEGEGEGGGGGERMEE
ncbi:hypothetical protein VTK26DRAFT_1419 [Humicola hyalothermophila]